MNSSDSIFEESLLARELPLAARLRPKSIDEVIGHDRYLRPTGLIGAMLSTRKLSSLILFGPPGVGKTTIAHAVAREMRCRFVPFDATSLGLKEIREIQLTAIRASQVVDANTVLFVDEVHRLTKIQSDALLKPVEDGVFTLIGATTENPWMVISPALLSRFLVVELSSPGRLDVVEILDRARDATGCEISSAAVEVVYESCGGDLRSALNLFEAAVALARTRSGEAHPEIVEDDVRSARPSASRGLSRSAHYEMTSALIKCMRTSDVDAALYWLARLLVSGEDPRFIARRLVIFASEDIGLADPIALESAHATIHATERIGMPEVRICLAHCVSYLSLAPKSRACCEAIDKAMRIAERTIGRTVPQHLRGMSGEIEIARGKAEAGDEPLSRFPKGIAEVNFLEWKSRD